MKNKSLIRKYYFVMSVCIVLIPISFILLNYMFLFIHTTLFSMLNVDKKFSSSFLYVNFYLFYFLLLFIFVIIGAKFFKNTIKRITALDNTLEEIIYKDIYPNKIEVSKNSQDEINLLAQTINKLIDRLRHKEMLLDTNLKTKNEHIQQLSHDINTPLTAITLELYELADDYHIPDEKIEHIYSRINYTSQLVKKVSEATEVDLQNQYLFLDDINISQLLNKSLDKWQYLLEKKQITIITNIDQNIIWNGDQLLYERLFDNILSNITHHSKTGEISIKLNNSQLIIEDYGIGFTVISNPPQKSGSGIINSICERMNLGLFVTSSKQGTKYVINLKNKSEVSYS